jgi:hypothetical protein
MAACVLLIHRLVPGTGTSIGGILFGVFLVFSVMFTAVAGVFLTADCISEEKREGTLGLLFLTDLAGYDVVLGKLFVHSLHAAYALMAGFPVIATCFLLGGVTGTDFWKLMLLLINSMGLSLSIGVFVSSCSRDALRSISVTLILLVSIYVGLWNLDASWGTAGQIVEPLFSWVSPLLAVPGILDGSGRFFWPCMLGVAALSGVLLTLATVITPRTWQQRADQGPRTWPGTAWRQRWSRRRRDLDPLAWLPSRDRGLTWLMAGAMLLVIPPGVYSMWQRFKIAPGTLMPTSGIFGIEGLFILLNLLIKFWVATIAIRYLIDSRKTGAFELLLVTPARPEAIVHGHWRALLRRFLIPVLLLTVLSGLHQAVQIRDSLRLFQASYANSNTTLDTDLLFHYHIQMASQGVLETLGNLTSAIALSWFGMWIALRTTRLNIALFQTIALSDFTPWIAGHLLGITFVLSLQSGLGTGNWLGILHSVVSAGAPILIDLILILVARKRVLARFLPVVTGDQAK